jgi:hypothetical protein
LINQLYFQNPQRINRLLLLIKGKLIISFLFKILNWPCLGGKPPFLDTFWQHKVVQNPHDGLKMSLAVTLVMATLVALFRPYAQAQAWKALGWLQRVNDIASTSENGGIVLVAFG